MTSGRITIVCSPEARGVIDQSVRVFEQLYPEAHIDVTGGTSREAVAALFGARADLGVITRELVPEERRAAVQGRLDVEGYRFARDAAVIVVNLANPLDQLTLDDVRRVYSGEVKNWKQLGGQAATIEPVVQPTGADVTEFFIEEVLGGEPIRAPSVPAASGAEVVRAVRERPGGIGYATLGESREGVRTVRLAALKGLPYFAADLEAVHDGTYPVTRFYSLYVRSRGSELAKGFITYVTSPDGQKLVRDAGLVPTTVPVRFVRRSPMLSTHTKGDSSHTP